MKSITINGSTRKALGKKSTKDLRKQDMEVSILKKKLKKLLDMLSKEG